jgi:short-subunit dehydrogenase
MDKYTLNEKTAFITGATSGIGAAIALAFARKGIDLFLTGRNLERLEELRRLALENGSNRVVIKEADLEKVEEIKELKSYFDENFSRIDILVNCAGLITLGSIETSTVEDFDSLYRVNLRAPFFLTQLFLSDLKKNKGQVVFVNSSSGLTTKPAIGLYTATKHGLKAIADTLQAEVRKDRIRVVSIFPKSTATPMQIRVSRLRGKKYHPEILLQTGDVAEVVVNALNPSALGLFYSNSHLQLLRWKLILFIRKLKYDY